MLLRWIAEVADEPLVLEPADRRVEVETNTWSLSTGDEERRSLTVAEVVAAFESTAGRIRERIRETGHAGAATFYVWHDAQAGRLKCSTGSVGETELPFGGAYVPTGDLGAVVAGYLADEEPGVVAWSELTDVTDGPEWTAVDREPVSFPVWVSAVGGDPA
ncbi:hypothetical protein [Kitasatospora camelliae]|uniref:Immunity protein Imm1 n=1 Tax=Kitasatospora camelliae TaxID=3156397 RepID=A0AAU8JP87_9ACTN